MDNSQRGESKRRLSRDVQLNGYYFEQDLHKWVTAQFVASNVSAEDVKNIRVVCEFYDPQTQYLDNEQWLLAGAVFAVDYICIWGEEGGGAVAVRRLLSYGVLQRDKGF